MQFEWDEPKNQGNQQKHGFAFEDAWRVLTAPHVSIPTHRNEEPRTIAIGMLHDKIVTMVYTMRGDQLYRIISIRRARNDEEKTYYAYLDTLR
ncbi:MAG: BrnT family toxin [Vampirovibrionales bacterium]|nr:BrnT family toxin [Vampirovibrionales bacterium]